MKIVVKKFGGSSLSTQGQRLKAVQHVEFQLAQGYSVVVVVSAMGRKGDPYATDSLLALVDENGRNLGAREKDLLLSCGEIISAAVMASLLTSRGHQVTVLTGGQAGIYTDQQFGDAQIIRVEPARVLHALEEGKLVIVPGFQGRSLDGEITTLGRGGSDTSAVALGAALHAEWVDIYTDVEGIMTADPRLVAEARLLDHVTYAEMANLAYQGAKVIHPRAVEIARQAGLPVRVKANGSDHPGTLISHLPANAPRAIRDQPVMGIAHVPALTQIKVNADRYSYQQQYDLQLKVFQAMAEHRISVDFINVSPNQIAYTVSDRQAQEAVDLIRQMGYDLDVTSHCAKVSAVGAGMAGRPGVMAAIVEALTSEGIQILQSADSHATIWILVKEKDMIRAVRALHRKFGLDANAKEEKRR
ncbi:MAG: aspartate kinase [Bacillus thermozeamaize]|jgi:aspartate kinase|uniref:Aspartokinase n=1 Tax=Bacillus thermozeamaize TaxID=230954 RepID=A0A1Y3PQH3_9BACI|nr:MAG: aspartate kinase [Bacillus thermozeamaize]